MFPVMEVSISGMVPGTKYSISMEFIPIHNRRYRFLDIMWMDYGVGEQHCEENLCFFHPDSPSTGKKWMSDKVSFRTLRLTNDKKHEKGNVSLCSPMNKYQ